MDYVIQLDKKHSEDNFVSINAKNKKEALKKLEKYLVIWEGPKLLKLEKTKKVRK